MTATLLAAVLVAAAPRAEVDALLARLEAAECRFQRNGEPYFVQCGTSKGVPSAEWLTDQLRALRVNRNVRPHP